VITRRWITARSVIRLQSIAPKYHEREPPVTTTNRPEGLNFAPEYDQPVHYIERTRSWYQALGYPHAYRWAHYGEVPFAPLRKPLARSCVTFVTTAARYQSDKGPQGPGAPYNAAAKFYTVYSGDTALEHDLRISHIAIDRVHTSMEDNRCWFPIEALRNTVATGELASLQSDSMVHRPVEASVRRWRWTVQRYCNAAETTVLRQRSCCRIAPCVTKP
jgi:hypothetical protein